MIIIIKKWNTFNFDSLSSYNFCFYCSTIRLIHLWNPPLNLKIGIHYYNCIYCCSFSISYGERVVKQLYYNKNIRIQSFKTFSLE